MEWKDRIQANPRLIRLKNPITEEIIDYEIQDLTAEEIIENGTPVNSTNMQILDDRITGVESTSCDMYKPDAGTVTNTYCLVAEYNISGQYCDFSDTISINRQNGDWAGKVSGMLVNIVGRNGDTSDISVNYLTSKIESVELIAVSNIVNEVANIKLYVKAISNYMDIYGKSLDFKSRTGVTRQYYKDQQNITELPSGTQIKGKVSGFVDSVSSTEFPISNNNYATMSFLSWWNGAYSNEGNSNLEYCKDGKIVGKNNIQSGNISTTTPASSYNSYNIQFPKAFADTPIVVATAMGNYNTTCQINNITTTGFTLNVRSLDGSAHDNRYFNWIAVSI